ncbi:MAG TPA: alpha-L-rhamnosidase C-terminal domain-containing protein, partial [Vicinamibacteria bacterium]|nr:alpha-L-rhamnosidase C-terminal domain-containing protein [Vicinamibacteria bacterium]
LALGLTTFPERREPSRSDCHPWSASPLVELLATVCGIEPGAPGFASVRIEPHPGTLRRYSGKMPHPRGMITVDYDIRATGLHAVIGLPEGLGGTLVWRGRSHPLHPGPQVVDLP